MSERKLTKRKRVNDLSKKTVETPKNHDEVKLQLKQYKELLNNEYNITAKRHGNTETQLTISKKKDKDSFIEEIMKINFPGNYKYNNHGIPESMYDKVNYETQVYNNYHSTKSFNKIEDALIHTKTLLDKRRREKGYNN